MRFGFQTFESKGEYRDRPCAKVRFIDDPDGIVQTALIDTGSNNTIASFSLIDTVVGDAEPVSETHLYLPMGDEDKCPIYSCTLELVNPEGKWPSITLPDVEVAFTRMHIPFVILGASALEHVVVVTRVYDRLLHIKTIDEFGDAEHSTDEAF